MSRFPRGRRIAPWFVAMVLVLALGGCATEPGIGSPTAAAPPAGASPSAAGQDAPPDARLAAEGGDPVTGQLGTYTWGASGSDSPWLPGAPVAVGAGEPLAVTFEPPGAIATWTAVYVRSDADGPAEAKPLASGAGDPAFAAPDAGSWTVDLEVTFLGGVGSAHYAWRLDVE